MSATVTKQLRCRQEVDTGKRNGQKLRNGHAKRKQVHVVAVEEPTEWLSSSLDTPQKMKVGSLLYIRDQTDCFTCTKLLHGSPRRLECCGAILCEFCSKRHKFESLSSCPFCKSNDFEYTVDEDLGKCLSINKKTIKQAMKKYGIQYKHIPDDKLIPDKLMKDNSSQRYFQTWGRAIHTGQHTCDHQWTSKRAYCVLDLRKQCIAYTAPKQCFTCKIPAKTSYDLDSLSRMVEYASRSYLRLSGKKQTHLQPSQEQQKQQPPTKQMKLVYHRRKEQHSPIKQVKQVYQTTKEQQSPTEEFTLLRQLDDMIILILNGTLKSATFAHWIHHTHHTMYGHDYWKSRL